MDEQRRQTLEGLRRQMEAITPEVAESALETCASRPSRPARGKGSPRGAATSDSACPVQDGAGEEADPEKAAWNRILSLCSRNEYCREKMAQRLKREGLPGPAVSAALERAGRCGLIDDARWGEMRASGLMRRGMGIPGIERELRGFKIDPGEIPGWPEEFSERFGGELERARSLLDAKPATSRNPRASAYARLVRKGYSQSVAAQAASQWAAEYSV